jgi:CubicO group peptidase (beta-lactamase class C family)
MRRDPGTVQFLRYLAEISCTTMIGPKLQRRTFLALGTSTLIAPQSLVAAPDANVLDKFIARYMKAMNAPGVTLALARREGKARIATFGFSDLESQEALTPDHLFQVGSITKSFVALTCLQLHDEGKLDLERPILEYLPWLPIVAKQGAITPHHLLTHTSGLPNALGLLMSDPGARYIQAYRPGEHFHYCNLGYCILGHLISSIDERPWAESVRRRIFEPFGMKASSAVIGGETQRRMARSYLPKFDDRLSPRLGEIAPTGYLVFDNAAGSVTSTPGDMALYMQMLMKGGAGVVSKGKLCPVHQAIHRCRGTRADVEIRLRHWRRSPGWPHHPAAHRRNGLFHVLADGGFRQRSGGICVDQRHAGLSAGSCHAVRRPVDERRETEQAWPAPPDLN